MNQNITVVTGSGAAAGLSAYQFLGIPYGTAKRFQKAVPVSWSGVLDCTAYRDKAPQVSPAALKAPGEPFSMEGSEDCLHLNIWTPSTDPAAGLPVVVYIHGGAFQNGCNSVPGYAGDLFAQGSPLVFISVNYRLGVPGNLSLGDLLGEEYADSGNQAELDVLLALRWIKENAAAFGGSPGRITLMGISAGAKIIGALMTLPESRDLFQQVIMESGAMQAFRSVTSAEEIRNRYLRLLPGTAAADLPGLPLEQLMRAQAELCSGPGSPAVFGPVTDGRTFAPDWSGRWDRGLCWQGRALVGSARHEMYRITELPAFREAPERIVRRLFGGNAGAVLRTQAEGDGRTWTQVLSDAMYRSPADSLCRRLMAADCPVWSYSFEYPPAGHGMGFHFAMRQEKDSYCGIPESERETAGGTAAAMNRCFRQFILCGDPDSGAQLPWKPLNPEGSKLCFGKKITACRFAGDSLPGLPDYTFAAE